MELSLCIPHILKLRLPSFSLEKKFRSFLLRLPFHVKHCISSVRMYYHKHCSHPLFIVLLVVKKSQFFYQNDALLLSFLAFTFWDLPKCIHNTYIVQLQSISINIQESVLYLLIWKWNSNKGKSSRLALESVVLEGVVIGQFLATCKIRRLVYFYTSIKIH